MSNGSNNAFMEIAQAVLQDYVTTCGVDGFDGQVIIAEDMANAYNELRRDLVENGTRDLSDIQMFHD